MIHPAISFFTDAPQLKQQLLYVISKGKLEYCLMVLESINTLGI